MSGILQKSAIKKSKVKSNFNDRSTVLPFRSLKTDAMNLVPYTCIFYNSIKVILDRIDG